MIGIGIDAKQRSKRIRLQRFIEVTLYISNTCSRAGDFRKYGNPSVHRMIRHNPSFLDHGIEKMTFNHPSRLIFINHSYHHLLTLLCIRRFQNYTKEPSLVQRPNKASAMLLTLQKPRSDPATNDDKLATCN